MNMSEAAKARCLTKLANGNYYGLAFETSEDKPSINGSIVRSDLNTARVIGNVLGQMLGKVCGEVSWARLNAAEEHYDNKQDFDKEVYSQVDLRNGIGTLESYHLKNKEDGLQVFVEIKPSELFQNAIDSGIPQMFSFRSCLCTCKETPDIRYFSAFYAIDALDRKASVPELNKETLRKVSVQ